MKNYIWYASYGSNLLEERFLCYINGGTPLGSNQTEKGARDHSPPLKSTTYSLPYEMYFAKSESKWGAGGVAFIKNQRCEAVKTYSKAYLITTEQFLDVVSQENQLSTIKMDFNTFFEQGFFDATDGWYGRIILAGTIDNIAVATFTTSMNWSQKEHVAPSLAYEAVLLKGLQELGLTNEESDHYLKTHYPKG